MSGSYPRGFIRSQRELDAFWNTRLCIGPGVLLAAAFAIFADTAGMAQSAVTVAGCVGAALGVYASFHYNWFGRLMKKVVGPYRAEDWQ